MKSSAMLLEGGTLAPQKHDEGTNRALHFEGASNRRRMLVKYTVKIQSSGNLQQRENT